MVNSIVVLKAALTFVWVNLPAESHLTRTVIFLIHRKIWYHSNFFCSPHKLHFSLWSLFAFAEICWESKLCDVPRHATVQCSARPARTVSLRLLYTREVPSASSWLLPGPWMCCGMTGHRAVLYYYCFPKLQWCRGRSLTPPPLTHIFLTNSDTVQFLLITFISIFNA